MTTANTALRISELDFDSIKTNLKNYLRNQSEFMDYDFEGSGLSVLLDILAYNTHYMGYYLNMIGNEMFLDTAQIRNSILSHAKLTNYRPRSRTAAQAIVNIVITPDDGATTMFMPKFTKFMSVPLNGVSYPFVTLEGYSAVANNVDGKFYFANVPLYQGDTATINYTVSNSQRRFSLLSANVDTSTVTIDVQESDVDTAITNYSLSEDLTEITASSTVYFIDEDFDTGQYSVQFGDNVLGKAPANNNIVIIKYINTVADQANKANSFINSEAISNYTAVDINPVTAAYGGSDRETNDQIRYRAPIHYTVQNRAVTKNDYGSILLKDFPTLDSVAIWGGEENDPVVYGKVYMSFKTKGDYVLTNLEKENIKTHMIKNRNVLTVTPEIVDPNYVWLLIDGKVTYDKKKTSLSSEEIKTIVRQAIIDYRDEQLNSFNSVFRKTKLQQYIENAHPSITGSDIEIYLQKRVEIIPSVTKRYQIDFNTRLRLGCSDVKLYTYPEIYAYDQYNTQRKVYMEEILEAQTGISSIAVVNAGRNYTSTPTVTITGDGTGATAEAVVASGRIESIKVTNKGTKYTKATVTISGGDGVEAQAVARLETRFGILDFHYHKTTGEKVYVNSNAGEIDYDYGRITIYANKIDGTATNSLYDTNILTINVPSEDDIIYPVRNRILSIDEVDPSSVVLNIVGEN